MIRVNDRRHKHNRGLFISWEHQKRQPMTILWWPPTKYYLRYYDHRARVQRVGSRWDRQGCGDTHWWNSRENDAVVFTDGSVKRENKSGGKQCGSGCGGEFKVQCRWGHYIHYVNGNQSHHGGFEMVSSGETQTSCLCNSLHEHTAKSTERVPLCWLDGHHTQRAYLSRSPGSSAQVMQEVLAMSGHWRRWGQILTGIPWTEFKQITFPRYKIMNLPNFWNSY